MRRISVPMQKKVKGLEGVSMTCSRSWLNRKGTSDPKWRWGSWGLVHCGKGKSHLRGPATTGAATGDGRGFVHLDTKRNPQRRFKARVYIKHHKSLQKKIHFLSTSHRGALKISEGQESQHPFVSLYPEGQYHVPYLSGTSARCIPTSPLPELRSEHTPKEMQCCGPWFGLGSNICRRKYP